MSRTPLSKATADAQDKLYHVVNDLLARLAIDGEVSTRSAEVDAVMDVLHDIDGGVYHPGPDPLDQALNEGDGAYRP